ncbi:hypothetical protein [Algoriphagus sp. Y33]|uniref:hypothetical protein n=1 Tax=Algoriphagus sp. Y33 TaxID=2772483 RepID=UPI001786D12D|nr:hypothetical protein [Algoriphagus sp. Y33]
MKTSNKIIVYFLTFAWLSIIATLLISHQFANYNNIPETRRTVITKTDLADFSVVKIEEADEISIVSININRNRFSYQRLAGADIEIPENEAVQDYIVRNDTLFIKNLTPTSTGGFLLEVKDLKHLIVSNTKRVNIVGFNQDLLLITAENSKVRISKDSRFSYLNLTSPGKLNLNFTSATGFSLVLDENQCKVRGVIKEISGNIRDNVDLIVPAELGKLDVNTSEKGKVTHSEPIELDQEEQ